MIVGESIWTETKTEPETRSTVWAIDSLTVTSTGSGRVDYYGSPTVSQSQSGSGNVSIRNLP